MKLTDRKETEVRLMLEQEVAPVPADLAARAVLRGGRLAHRRHTLHTIGWLAVLFAVIALVVWTAVAEPWTIPPADTTPPVGIW